jgi:hypothetical protein
MMQNVINNAFEGVRSVSVGVELLEAFSHLAKRPSIQRVVDKRAVAMWALMKQTMDTTKVCVGGWWVGGGLVHVGHVHVCKSAFVAFLAPCTHWGLLLTASPSIVLGRPV